MLRAGLGDRVRKLFSSGGADDEAAEREEYGVPDRAEAGLERDRIGPLATSEGAEAAEAELDELRLRAIPPRDRLTQRPRPCIFALQ